MEIQTIGKATLYLGDCREVLSQIKADVLISDPPYGISLENHSAGKDRRTDGFSIVGDKCQTAGLDVLIWAEDLGLPTVYFASPRKPWPGEWRNFLVWDKGGAVGGGGDPATCWKQTWELIQVARNGALNGRRDEAVIRKMMTPQMSELHPAQKPVTLMRYLVDKVSQPGQTVFDAFMGSGSTGVAAVENDRFFVGCEVERRHFDTACSRIFAAQQQMQLALQPLIIPADHTV